MKSEVVWAGLMLLLLPFVAQAQTYSRSETIVYSDNMAKWVLGQTASITCTVSVPASTACNGDVVSQTTYETTYALPIQSKAFGKIQQTLGYDVTSSVASGQRGTLKTVKDGNNNVTSLTSWKRGIPQVITYPATTDQPTAVSQKATVDDSGWIRSVTDENGFVTKYDYDPAGRLKLIDYPDGDSVAWTSTLLSFAPNTGPKYGLPLGHWVQIVGTGAGRKVTYFDALWRPVVEEAYDNTSAAQANATRSIIVKRYDPAGRLAFQSYPMRSLTNYATVTAGTTTTYDALDRVTQVSVPSSDSTTGTFKTTTEYLAGFKTRVTNPRGHATTIDYQVYDEPSTDAPIAITHPEGAYTEIVRDVFGKPLSVKRRNSTGTLAATRYWMYDANQILCKSVEPETGTTTYKYDGADNLIKTNYGIPSITPSACSSTLVQTDGIPPPTGGGNPPTAAHYAERTYDARNRLKTLVFSDGKGNQTWTYTPDGLPASVAVVNPNVANPVLTSYTYSRRRLLTKESLQPLGGALALGLTYSYNTNAHLASLTYPTGLSVAYAPNALGQPTQAGSYATGVSYFSNGGIARLTYGNGIVHTMTQNDRQLPERSRDVYGSTVFLDDSYDFDGNGNVAGISDALSAHRGDRIMTYDGLDRLTATTSPMYGAGATYTYDVLDNLTRVKVGGTAARDQFYCYDANWRLTNVKTGSCTGSTVIGLGYDVQGNLANKNGVAYTFDHGNRLRGSPGYWYAYDGLGRRILSCTPSACGYQQYSQAGQALYGDDKRHGTRSESIFLSGSLVAIRELSTASGVFTVKYQHTDALGSPVASTSQARGVLERSEYEPFGRLLNRALKDGPGYTGHVSDVATGLSYMQQRYYDSQIGRFLSVDPVTADAMNGDNFNRYWYARNNPYTLTDPDGRWSPKAHDALLQHAFTSRLTAQDIKTLQQSSREFDKQTQSSGESHKHSMAQEGQSGADAIKQRDSFIGKTMVAARDAADQGDRQGALTLLGQALHPVMDSSSPEHTNSDGTPKEWRGVVSSTLDGQRHSPTDFIGDETSSDITPAAYRSQDQRLNNAYNWVFGGQHNESK